MLVLSSKFKISYFIVIILVFIFCIFFGFSRFSRIYPIDAFNVYIDGKLIGTIESDVDFYSYINMRDEAIKEKYGVNKVYVPNGVDIKKVVTYNNKIDSNDSIYNKIINLKKFTIKGTIITVKNNNIDNDHEVSDELFSLDNNSLEDDVNSKDDSSDTVIYVTSKDVFDDAVLQLIKSFVSEEDYNNYIENKQTPIVDVGSVIKDIDIFDDVYYKSGYISVDNEIFSDSKKLARYLLYGTLEKQDSYIVKEGDTIESIANDNKLNVQEFLLANPSFKSENTLIYEGQTVNVGLINPVIDIVVEWNKVLDEERNFNVNIKYDENQLQNVEYVSQEGEKGLFRVNREYQYINGQLIATQALGSVELKPVVDKVIVKGKKEVPNVADLSYWAWPTDNPYTITTYYGYRWGSMHAAIDIYGPGWGSNIYAANNGTVVEMKMGCSPGNLGCNGRRGNYLVINHNNQNYYTEYMHMANIIVNVGDTVSRGQKIGTMGNTGEVYPVPSAGCGYCGTHLHFGTYRGMPHIGGVPFDPMTLY